MTIERASDNPFPSILNVEGTTPATPAAGQQRLFIRSSDHVLCYVNSSGTVTAVGAASGLTDPMTTRGDVIVRNASNVTARLGRGSAGQVLTSDGTDLSWATPAGGGAGNGLIQFEPLWSDPTATTGTWASILFSDVGTPLVNAPAMYNSSSAQNDALTWDIWLDAGTYTFSAWVRKTSNTGIITLNQAGASQGTVDTYAASPALALVSITGWTVASSGKKAMQVKAATKNASSSGYLLEFFSVIFRRTA